MFSLGKKLKLNLNSCLVAIFVLRLVKPLSETASETAQRKLKSHIVYERYLYHAHSTVSSEALPGIGDITSLMICSGSNSDAPTIQSLLQMY